MILELRADSHFAPVEQIQFFLKKLQLEKFFLINFIKQVIRFERQTNYMCNRRTNNFI